MAAGDVRLARRKLERAVLQWPNRPAGQAIEDERKACFVSWTTALIGLPSTLMLARIGAAGNRNRDRGGRSGSARPAHPSHRTHTSVLANRCCRADGRCMSLVGEVSRRRQPLLFVRGDQRSEAGVAAV